jgi:hypothetical protein
VTFAPKPTVIVLGATPEPEIAIVPPEADVPPVVGSVGDDELLAGHMLPSTRGDNTTTANCQTKRFN